MPVVLGAQLLFNVGFYAVVPFLVVVLTEDFALSSAAVGIVLGVRTAAQQGMFLLGGMLTDRFGARVIILLGCGVRIAGFLTLAGSLWIQVPQLWLFVLGTVLTGLGGALFSPGVNTLVGEADTRRRSEETGTPRATLFAWLGLTGEIGAVLGPLAGATLLGWGFPTVAAAGAGLFVVIAVFLWWALPRTHAPRRDTREDGIPARPNPWRPLRNRRFLAFAALHSVDLLAYNQLYLTVPLALRQVGGGTREIGLMFAWVSLLTLALQLPVARGLSKLGTGSALRCGYLASALGFATIAVGAVIGPDDGRLVAFAPVFAGVTFLTLGHLSANPTALGAVPGIARGRATGAYFGLLATFGGIAVLLGNTVAGGLIDDTAPAGALLPAWVFLTVLPLLSGALIPSVLRRRT